MHPLQQIELFTHEIGSAHGEDALFESLAKAARWMGFTHFALAYDRRSTGPAASLLLHDYPDTWASLYLEYDLARSDPVRRAGERSLTGFCWAHLDHFVPLTRGDRQLLALGREHGIADGYTVPRHLPGEATGSCSFAVGPGTQLPGSMLTAAEIIGAQALASARRLANAAPGPRPVALSDRQRECILWSARGKTAHETAEILGIAGETVVQHLKTARERYDVHCRQMLILCAMFDGLIGFADIYDWWRRR